MGVEADEGGVDDFGVGIVDLEVAELFDASLDHVGEGAGCVECFVGAAVAVGVGGEVCGIGEEEVAGLGIEAWHDALLEEHDVLWIEAEVVVLCKERDGLLMVERAGHDVPGDGCLVLSFVGIHGLCEHFEE